MPPAGAADRALNVSGRIMGYSEITHAVTRHDCNEIVMMEGSEPVKSSTEESGHQPCKQLKNQIKYNAFKTPQLLLVFS
jgi:hypothetical protein